MRRARLDDLDVSPRVRDALRRFLAALDDDSRRAMDEVILFGSVARGEARERSDVDVLVVWHGSLATALDSLIRASTQVLIDTGVDLSVHPFVRDQFARIAGMRSGFFEEVDREGIIVAR